MPLNSRPLQFALLLAVFVIGGTAAFFWNTYTPAPQQAGTSMAPETAPISLPPPVPMQTEAVFIQKQNGEQLEFIAELAVLKAQQAQGLMNRTQMPENAGMLFVFDRIQPLSFWMKDTLIPLDMLFLQPDGTIHHIHHNAIPHDRTSIRANAPSKAVLEINGGLADKLGIKEGDSVRHRFFGNTVQPGQSPEN